MKNPSQADLIMEGAFALKSFGCAASIQTPDILTTKLALGIHLPTTPTS